MTNDVSKEIVVPTELSLELDVNSPNRRDFDITAGQGVAVHVGIDR